jgi:beta-glucanase (GH16 family)
MGRIISLTILFFTTLTVSSQNWLLKWEDNFDVPVLNESTHWKVEVNGDGGGNQELQYYRRENITIENYQGENCLVINAKKENFSDKLVTSGRLTTQNKISVKYGKIEARIQLPKTANGLWPAFWMMGEDISTVGWPRCGETDILEMGSGTGISQGIQEKYFNGACHFGETHAYNAQDAIADYSLQNDFHLYTLIWDANSIKMYLDMDKYPANDPYFEMNISESKVIGQPGYYFHKPFFVLLNLAVGGTFTGITGNSNINSITALSNDGTPAKMYVDFVRIYQRGDVGEEFFGPKTAIYNENPIPALNASNVISIFSDPYINIVEKFDMWYATEMSEIVAGTNKIKLISNLATGSAFGTPDFSPPQNLSTAAMEKLHVDIFPVRQSAMHLGIVTSTGECKLPLTLQTGVWNSISLSLSDLKANNPSCDFSEVKQVGFWMVDGNFYMDNLLFYKGDYQTVSNIPDLHPKSEIRIFPNPAQDILYLKSDEIITQLAIYNSTGQLIRVLNTNSNETTIDLSQIHSGVYVLIAKINDESLIAGKFVKL